MELKTVNAIHTSCHDCAFAQYIINEEQNGLQQVGCGLDKLKTFENVELCSNGLNDEFFVIDNELCLHKRNAAWAKQYGDKIQEQINKEIDLINCPLTCVLLIQEDCTEDDILTFLDKLSQQTYKPKHLAICITAKNTPKRSWLVKTLNDKLSIPWFINSHNPNILDLIEDSVKDLHSIYYSLLNIKDDLKPTFFERLNKVIKNNKKFFVIRPTNDKYSYMSVMLMAHKIFGGNHKSTLSEEYGDPINVDCILDKIEVICKDKEKMEFIKTNAELGIPT